MCPLELTFSTYPMGIRNMGRSCINLSRVGKPAIIPRPRRSVKRLTLERYSISVSDVGKKAFSSYRYFQIHKRKTVEIRPLCVNNVGKSLVLPLCVQIHERSHTAEKFCYVINVGKHSVIPFPSENMKGLTLQRYLMKCKQCGFQ
jgi:hypothetical protein